MEGRGAVAAGAAGSGSWQGSRPWYRRSSACGQVGNERLSHERESQKTIEKNSENITLYVDLSSSAQLRNAEAAEAEGEEQQQRPRQKEGEEWKRKKGAWGTSSLRQGPPIFLQEEDEDGVHGGRMKPLASFDVNRGLPPPAAQNKKFRIKLSRTNENTAPTMIGAAPKGVRRAQDKENGGLVPLFPGTTHIRGMKRKTASPTGVKPHGKKRSRVEVGAGKAVDQSRKGLAESSNLSSEPGLQRGDSSGMDFLLMALTATQSPLSAQAVNAERVPTYQSLTGKAEQKKARQPTSSVGVVKPHRYRGPPLQPSVAKTKVLRDDQHASRKEGMKGTRCRDTHSIQSTLKSSHFMGKSRDQHHTNEVGPGGKYRREKDEIIMKPHRYRLAPAKPSGVEGRGQLEARKEKEASNVDVEVDTMKPHRYQQAARKPAAVECRDKPKVRRGGEGEMSCSGNDLHTISSDEELVKYVMRPHQYVPGPMKSAVDQRKGQLEGRKAEQESKSCSDEQLQTTIMNPQPVPVASSRSSLDKGKVGFDASKEDEEKSGCSDEDLNCRVYELDKYAMKLHHHQCLSIENMEKAEEKFEESSRQDEGESTASDEGESTASDEDFDSTDDELENFAMKPHRYKFTSKEDLEEMRLNCNAQKEEEGEPSCSDNDLDKYAMKQHRYQPAPSKEALDEKMQPINRKTKEKDEPSCSDDDLDKYVRKPHIYKAVDGTMHRYKEETKEKDAESSCSDDDLDKYVRKPHIFKAADGTMHQHKDETKEKDESSCSDDDLDKYVMRPHAYKAADGTIHRYKEETREKDESSCSDDELDTYMRKPHLYKASIKSSVQHETRKDLKEKRSCSHEEDDEPTTGTQCYTVLPSQAKVLLSQEQLINRAAKGQGFTGPSSIAIDNHEHHKVPGSKPLEHDCGIGTSLLLEVAKEDLREVGNLERTNQGGKDVIYPFVDSNWVKYPRARHHPTRKESSSEAGGGSLDKRPCNSKKRDHTSAFWETWEPSHPSIGTVLVECLPPSIEQKELDGKAVFDVEIGSHDFSQGPIFKSGKEVGNRETDNGKRFCASGQERTGAVIVAENQEQNKLVGASSLAGVGDTFTTNKFLGRSLSSRQFAQWREDTASNCPSSATRLANANSTQISEGVTVAHYDGSSSLIPGLVSVLPVAPCMSSLEDPLKHPELPLQISRTHLAPAHPKTSQASALPCRGGSREEDQRSSAPKAGSVSCNGYNEDNAAHHEIAGVTMQRRSWEALKSAEYLAERRFDPKVKQTFGSNVPFIPSRFQDAKRLDQGVSKELSHSSEPSFESQFSRGAALAGFAGATTTEKKVRQRRGPRQGPHERLSVKVLTKSVENYAQLKDSSCPSGVGFSWANQIPNRQQAPASGCYSGLPPLAYAGLPKAAPLKTRQKRGQKKLEKEMFILANRKPTSSTSNKFKQLAEPSGLLGDFNPGIIQRVRNSKQIQAILGALIGIASSNEARGLRPVTLPQVPQKPALASACVAVVETESRRELKEESLEIKKILHTEKDFPQGKKNCEEQWLTMGDAQIVGNGLVTQDQDIEVLEEQLQEGNVLLLNEEEQPESLAVEAQTNQSLPETDGLMYPRFEVTNANCLQEHSVHIRQEPSTAPGNAESTEKEHEQEMQPMSRMGSSPAGLAAQWLQLLTLDIKGRLSALKRSQRRVRSTLQSQQLDPENRSASVVYLAPPLTGSMEVDAHGSQESVCSDAATAQARQIESLQQVDRWCVLFTNMDGVLSKEAAKLESWLWQIQQMQAFCPDPNQQIFCGPAKSHLADCEGVPASTLAFENHPPHRWSLTTEAIEKELGLAASAASILSTANFATKVQSFR